MTTINKTISTMYNNKKMRKYAKIAFLFIGALLCACAFVFAMWVALWAFHDAGFVM